MTQQQRAYVFGLSAVLCWSTVATAFKLSLIYLSPPQLLLCAALTSWCLLLGMVVYTRKWRLAGQALKSLREASAFAVMGLLNPFLYYLVLFKAYDALPAQEAQAINYTWALTLTLLSVPLLKQRLYRRDLLAAAVCYTGVLVIATRGEFFSLEFANPSGVTLALISTLLWAFYWIFNTRNRHGPLISLFLNFSFALPMIVLYCWLTGEIGPLPWRGVAGAVYVGLFEMGISFILWLHAMKLTHSTASISNLIFLSPILSLVFIATFLGEAILPSTLVGLGLVIAGLLTQKLWRKD